jgi:hypothetical protein
VIARSNPKPIATIIITAAQRLARKDLMIPPSLAQIRSPLVRWKQVRR